MGLHFALMPIWNIMVNPVPFQPFMATVIMFTVKGA